MNPIRIGLFGFGVVGEGLYKALAQTPTLQASIETIVIKHPDKPRNAPEELFTTNASAVLNNAAINVVVEVIDDADAAFSIVQQAMQNGKAVVSASKKMLALHLPELLALQASTGRPLLYEAAACASIPVIRNLEEYYDNDLLQGLQGIVNGSTNYMLTKMLKEGLGYQQALKQAQLLGFAESNPKLDVEGYDAAYKWILLLLHAYGLVLSPADLVFTGIQNVTAADVEFARSQGCTIKLVATARQLQNGEVAAFVLPQWVPQESALAFVQNEFNGVVVESGFAEQQFFYGKGAGSLPTASAVLADVAALRYGYKYGYHKQQQGRRQQARHFWLRVVVRGKAHLLPGEQAFAVVQEVREKGDELLIKGLISYETLATETWWKQPGVSLVVLAGAAVVETLGVEEADAVVVG